MHNQNVRWLVLFFTLIVVMLIYSHANTTVYMSVIRDPIADASIEAEGFEIPRASQGAFMRSMRQNARVQLVRRCQYRIMHNSMYSQRQPDMGRCEVVYPRPDE